MKPIIPLLLLLLIISGCKSKSKAVTSKPDVPEVKFVEVELDELDATQKKKAYELGKRVLMTCNTSRFKPFTKEEATDKVIENTTQARRTKTCLKFRLKYGDFKDLRLVEAFRIKNSNLTIYRYKADYTKAIANKELRVTMNDQNQITSLKSTDWTEDYKPL